MQVVVCTTASASEARRINEICHTGGIAFIWGQTRGLFARIFTDFGPAFTVYDVNGEAPSCGCRCGSHQSMRTFRVELPSLLGVSSSLAVCIFGGAS